MPTVIIAIISYNYVIYLLGLLFLINVTLTYVFSLSLSLLCVSSSAVSNLI